MLFSIEFRTASVIPYKVILSLSDVTSKPKDIFEHGSYQCHPDHVYVVVGKYFNLKNISITNHTNFILVFIHFRK